MRKKISGTILAILAMLLMTSCQVIEQAVEDTFRPLPQKHEAPDDPDQGLLEKVEGFLVGDLFIETGMNLTTFDIEDDVFAKLDLEDPILDFELFVREYIRKNEIEHYLTQEEAQDLVDLFNSHNLILNPDRTIQELEDLTKDLAWDEVYVHSGLIDIYKDHISMELHKPENYNHVDSYSYDVDEDEWQTRPMRNLDSDTPLERALLLTDIPLRSLYKVTEASLEVLKEIGEYNEDFPYENASTFRGIQSIRISLYRKDGERIVLFESTVRGERDHIILKFDSDGNLIEKQR
jgi:hypothetical protein